MNEQWQELKETIIELRDGDGTTAQQEVCKFLANYMDILEKQMQEPCEDAVSRDMALEKMADYAASGYADSVKDFEEYSRIICQLPPVNPQPKIGHWIMHEKHRECSECGVYLLKDMPRNSYCSNCGAKMQEVEE